jgi:hypothetical protein
MMYLERNKTDLDKNLPAFGFAFAKGEYPTIDRAQYLFRDASDVMKS